MLTGLRLRNFKSWADTGEVELRPITGFFGAHSSGKTSLLHALLLLKQTAASAEPAQVFHFGDRSTLVDLGDFTNVVHGRDPSQRLEISLDWKGDSAVVIRDLEKQEVVRSSSLGYRVTVGRIGTSSRRLAVGEMAYRVGGTRFGMRRSGEGYELFSEGTDDCLVRRRGRSSPLPPPVRCNGFPDEVGACYLNAGFLFDRSHDFTTRLNGLRYLGPLRARPERCYHWNGAEPEELGGTGEGAVAALLAARVRGDRISVGEGRRRRTLEEHVAYWLRELGLIREFRVEPLAEGLPIFQVLARRTADSAEIPMPDVGFGVSRILPALVLCFYAPKGSTIILEQPEIQLHPAVQARLADVLIDAHRRRGVQILLESHSEPLLRRLVRRVADETLSNREVGIWFTEDAGGASRITRLQLDEYGGIANWPRDFFGDDFAEVADIVEHRVRRRNSMSGRKTG